MDYNGDTPEDVRAKEVADKLVYDPEEGIKEGWEQFIAYDFFQYGWEACMEFCKQQGFSN